MIQNRARHFARCNMVRGGRWRTILRYKQTIDKKIYGKSEQHHLSLKERKRKKRIRIYNRKLCKLYPFLIPHSVWTGRVVWNEYPYSNTELDAIPVGWRKAFGRQLAEDIKQALILDGVDPASLRFHQIKEKYGQLRLYTNFSSPHLEEVIRMYEVISEGVCIRCGKLDVPNIYNYGWWSPYCKECYYDSVKKLKSPKSYEDVIRNSYEDAEKIIEGGDLLPNSYTIRGYSPEEGHYEKVVDISETVQKIRRSNKGVKR